MKRKRRRDEPATRTYSVAQTAQIFGVSASTIRRRIDDKSTPIIEGLGRIKRVPKWWVDKQLGQGERSE